MSIIENARRLRPIIEKAVESLDDSTALEAVELYPAWVPGMELAEGARVRYGGTLYKVNEGQAHTALADWTPDVATSLFTVVNVSASGTADDPIPYDGNMELTEGLYYTQEGVVYLCTRSTGTAVYHALSELVGLYVEAVTT